MVRYPPPEFLSQAYESSAGWYIAFVEIGGKTDHEHEAEVSTVSSVVNWLIRNRSLRTGGGKHRLTSLGPP